MQRMSQLESENETLRATVQFRLLELENDPRISQHVEAQKRLAELQIQNAAMAQELQRFKDAEQARIQQERETARMRFQQDREIAMRKAMEIARRRGGN